MSDGLKLISSLCATGTPRGISQVTEDWLLPNEAEVLRFVRGHHRRYSEYPSLATIRTETGQRMAPNSDSFEYWLDRIRKRHIYSHLRPEFQTLKDLLSRTDGDTSDLITHLGSMQAIARTNSGSQDVFTMSQGVDILLEEYHRAKANRGLAGVPTGWDELDAMSGGWMPADLNMLIARPSIGKTFHLLKSVLAADAAGFGTLLCTMEMPVDQIMRRMAGMLCGVDPRYIKTGRMSTRVEQRFLRTLEDLRGNELMNVVSGGMKKSVGQLDPVVGEHNPDAVYIDGIYLMMSDRSQRLIKRAERMESVVSEIKEHTMIRQTPYFCTSQFNRDSGSGGKAGTLETVGYSDAVGTDSSLVLSLKEGIRMDGWRDTRILEVMKGRDGETGAWLVNHLFSPPNFDIICPYNQTHEGEENNDSNTAGTDTANADFDWSPTAPTRPTA